MVPFISQATKCKVKISNFYYNEAAFLSSKADYLFKLSRENVNIIEISFHLVKYLSFQITDVIPGQWILSPKRTQWVKFSSIIKIDNLITILSAEEKAHSKFNLLTTFQPITWWFLIVSLIICSLVNVKLKTNFIYQICISIINHFECLLTKQSKYLKKKKLFYSSFLNFVDFSLFKVGSLSSNRIYSCAYLSWIFGSLILVTLFSNDILSKLINPSIILIDSIEQLNARKPTTTTWFFKYAFAIRTNMVKLILI